MFRNMRSALLSTLEKQARAYIVKTLIDLDAKNIDIKEEIADTRMVLNKDRNDISIQLVFDSHILPHNSVNQ